MTARMRKTFCYLLLQSLIFGTKRTGRDGPSAMLVPRKQLSGNRPRLIYQYSNMAPRLSGQNCKFFKFHLSLDSQKRLGNKENNAKFRSLSRKTRSHVRILIYRTWPIEHLTWSINTREKSRIDCFT